MIRPIVTVAALGILAGCAPASQQDLELFTQAVQQRATPGISPPPELPELEKVSYNGNSNRNPFQPTKLRPNRIESVEQACPQPDLDRPKSELEGVALDQVGFTGTMQSGSSALVGLVVTNEGRLYRVQKGHYIGLNLGQITAIEPEEISIREWLATGDGCWQQRTVSLNLLNSQRSSN